MAKSLAVDLLQMPGTVVLRGKSDLRSVPKQATDNHRFDETVLCGGVFDEKFKSWHRTNVARAADLIAIRVGRVTSQGRPIIWSLVGAAMRSLCGRKLLPDSVCKFVHECGKFRLHQAMSGGDHGDGLARCRTAHPASQ
jgi:hypothetical protein